MCAPAAKRAVVAVRGKTLVEKLALLPAAALVRRRTPHARPALRRSRAVKSREARERACGPPSIPLSRGSRGGQGYYKKNPNATVITLNP